MDMILYALVLLYAVGYGFCFKRIAGQIAWHFLAQNKVTYSSLYRDKHVPDGEMWVGAIIQALIYSVAWPVAYPLAIGISQANDGTGGKQFFYIPQKRKDELRETYIKELERKAGL